MSEVKDRLPLLISIVISPVVDKLQEYGKEQWNAEELLQLQFRLNGESIDATAFWNSIGRLAATL